MSDGMTHEPGPPNLPRLFDVERTNHEIKLTIRGALDINSAPLLVEEISRIVATKPSEVKVDLSALDLIDSSGVAALVKLGKAVRGIGGATVFSGMRGQPLAIFKIISRPQEFSAGREVRIDPPPRPGWFARLRDKLLPARR
jgi:anti-anti-sigma factor